MGNGEWVGGGVSRGYGFLVPPLLFPRGGGRGEGRGLGLGVYGSCEVGEGGFFET